MLGIFAFISGVFGLLLAKMAIGMKLVGIYILMTVTGLVLFLCGTYVFGFSSIQAAIGSIAFTLVFLVSLIGHKKKAKEKENNEKL